MDIEQLKLILEAVNNTVGDAKTVAVTWLAVEGVTALLGYLMGAGVLFTIYKIATKIIQACTDTSFLTKLRNEAIPSQAYGAVLESEKAFLMKIVSENAQSK